MHVFRCLDDALQDLRKTFLNLHLSHPVFIKIMDETEERELHVFKIELGSILVNAQDALLPEVQTGDAMEVDGIDPSIIVSNSGFTTSPLSPLADDVANEIQMAASMLQLGGDVAPTTSESESEDGDSINDNVLPRMSGRHDRQRPPAALHLDEAHSSSKATARTKRKSSFPRPSNRKKTVKHKGNDDDEPFHRDGPVNAEVQIVALTNQLKEAYDQRSSVAVDVASPSKVLELVRQVLAQSQADGPQSPLLLLGQCGMHVTSLITTSSAQKMVGYYLRSVLAHHLKQSSRRQYTRLARQVLGIKSATDIAAYPAFFDFIQRYCSSIAVATTQGIITEEVMSQWLREPLFIADISWTEWRRYLSKSNLPITAAAVQRFLASIDSFKDWMQLGWVEIYDDEQLGGQGVRALRDIHLPSSKAKQAQRDVASSISVTAADLHSAGSDFVKVKDPTQEVDPKYLLQLDKHHVFDARHHWIGKINHLPMPHCSLKVTGKGKMIQIKEIKKGEPLTLDYGMEYWVYQVTGLDASEWLSEGSAVCQRGRLDLFTRMHESVMDYSELLREKLARSLSSSSSAVEREGVMLVLGELLGAESHCHME